MTNTLLPLQERFQQHMLGQADATPLLAGCPDRRQLGLAIYANAYRRRLVDVLADAYAKTRSMLGDDDFDDAALSYIDTNPPETRNLRWFGAGFAAHLLHRTATPAGSARAAACKGTATHAAAEMAHLDWALRQAFDGPDSAVLVAADLAEVPADAWADLTLTPVPTTTLLRFRHNTVAIWQALDDERDPPIPACEASEVDWLVWRKALRPHFRSLHPVEAALLRAMVAGAPFARACEQAQALSSEDCTGHIGAGLRQWLDDGLLSTVVMPTDAG